MKRVEFDKKDGINIIRPSGEMTFFFLDDLEYYLKENIKANEYRYIFDMSKMNWIDSMGLGLIAMTVKIALLNNSRVCIVNPRDNIVELLRLSSLVELVKIFETMDGAFHFFNEEG